MAVGFAKDGAEQLEMEAVVQAAITHARAQVAVERESAEFCFDCDEKIPEARRQAIKGVIYCVGCQSMHDEIFKREPRNCWHRSMR
ncbi:hypothetical protein PP428_gp131 [Escherichia phage vB_EcoM_RZ]|jgi:phage/conjugal plasmid C-4 type zinc finger TraR family protein|uniref:Zinc finger DksA/TraR C4-type domain-containing protein n=1 Tax=Escherichia phage vB_EcoM_RZ TaxID=2893954 RepID=A0AAE9C7Z4_9CAUD|nr:hypothetical protein PP428_gp131 [Escherichia phage vB_EcoM_RZ]QMP18848.1 hypothetical protein CJ20_252 [Escherichia phage CJ20]QQG30805.1 TraR family zinc finger protein [Escherichia phage UPEC01]QWQ55752.1 hypothetical protein [Escherichia phage P479]UHS65319.1 hypothetical protein [Escherichia phage P896]UGL59947.1 hypothetical protein [Escherichia phage vB_EcoM_RZ]